MTVHKPLTRGYVHVYTGHGKGKTTAALGLALRATGAGLRVYMGQLVKGLPYSEHRSLERLGIDVERFGRPGFIHDEPSQEDKDAARAGLERCRAVLEAGHHDVVILDEANIATFFKLLTVEDLLGLIEIKAPHVELVFTGRYAEQALVDAADLVTEMTEVRHYYAEGVEAREGIEM